MTQSLLSFEDFMARFEALENFAFTKINHGFWEKLGEAYARFGRPVPRHKRRQADRLFGRVQLFESGFAEELQALLLDAVEQGDPALHVGIGLSAWPDDERVFGTPRRPDLAVPVLQQMVDRLGTQVDGLVLKRAVMDGKILALFERLRDFHVILVGPPCVGHLIEAAGWSDVEFLELHPSAARASRTEIREKLAAQLEAHVGRPPCVLLQAGTLAPYLLLHLRADFPQARWIDGGLALSIAHPEDLLQRAWGQVYRAEILTTYERLRERPPIPRRAQLPEVGADLERAEREAEAGVSGRVAFVEDKPLDWVRMGALLAPARRRNQWSNYGPAWEMLGRAYERYLGLPDGLRAIPCANGGIALSALASLHALRAGRPLRWVVSAFGFANTDRGVFAGATVLDCDERGCLDLDALARLDPGAYDGVALTNPFGVHSEFEQYARLCRRRRKILLLDNASGVRPGVPELPYQAFSLHQTKPFGLGEGGLLVLPEADGALAMSLMDYSPLEPDQRAYWVGNGKLSELACAALLQRLEVAPEWVPLYQMQSGRICAVAERAGLRRLVPRSSGAIATSLPFLLPDPTPLERLRNPHFAVGKYYRPLVALPRVSWIYERLVNLPAHPDMRRVDTAQLLGVLRGAQDASRADGAIAPRRARWWTRGRARSQPRPSSSR